MHEPNQPVTAMTPQDWAKLQVLLSKAGIELPPAATNRPTQSTNQTVGDVAESLVIQSGDYSPINVIMGAFAHTTSAVNQPEAEALAEYLRISCLEWRRLPLDKVDKLISDVGASFGQPELDKVYIDVNVQEPRPTKKGAGRSNKDGDDDQRRMFEEDRRTWSAGEACEAHQRLVIRGAPGSGKSTFVRMLALRLAEQFATAHAASAGSKVPAANLQVPIIVTLRDFAAVIPEGQADLRLLTHIEECLSVRGCPEAIGVIKKMIQHGRAVVLLDGLDEIGQPERRESVLEAVQSFARRFDKVKVLVTCRVAAYPKTDEAGDPNGIAAWRLNETDFPIVTIAPFNLKQMKNYIGAYYHELARKKRISGDPTKRIDDLRRAVDRPHIQRLAANPLLLWVMLNVHASGIGKLPDQRVKLYQEGVEMLLWKWRPIGDAASSEGAADRVDALLDQVGRTPDSLEPRLHELAFRVHRKAPAGKDVVVDIRLESLRKRLRSKNRNPLEDKVWQMRLIDAIKHQAGLLIEIRDGVFTFPHRTFQEYLAARHIAKCRNWIDVCMRLLDGRNGIWREVVLMVGGVFSHLQDDAAKAVPLLKRLVDDASGTGSDSPGPNRRVTRLLFAADLACEVQVAKLNEEEEGRAVVARLREALLRGMFDSAIEMKSCASLASSLGRVGDPRPGVVPPLGSKFPTIEWASPIPPGPFPMGNDDDSALYPDEKPRFTCNLVRQAFALSRYPITVAQYRLFIEAGGYTPSMDRYWTQAGLAWRNEHEVDGPEAFDEVFQTPNHPQVGVSWYEATAFSRWLAECLELPIRLPTEPEWELAVRGTDSREFPWSFPRGADVQGATETSDSNSRRANFKSEIGHTTAVGLYSNGAAECGAADAAGNVWEWCGTAWLDSYADYNRLHTAALDGALPRVLRGGSWFDSRVIARCASRVRYHPDFRHYVVGFRVCVSPFSHSAL